MDWIIGITGSVLVGGAAYGKRWLTLSGAAAAVGVGTLMYALGSLVWFGLVIGFFVTSSLLTKWRGHMKKEAETKYQKSGRRDAGQVLANGGMGTLLCMAHALYPEASWPLWAYVGVMASVTADTWATEVGGISRSLPRSIVTWRPVPKGTSGAVSGLGWTASALGGGFIGLLACFFSIWDKPSAAILTSPGWSWTWVALGAMLSGWIGANADSALGATLQALYKCSVCGREVESSRHCGKETTLVRGIRRMDNDAVNMISSACGGAIMVLLAATAMFFR